MISIDELDEHVDSSIDCIYVRTEEMFSILYRVYIENSTTLDKAIKSDINRKKQQIDNFSGKFHKEVLETIIIQYSKYVPYYNSLLNNGR